MLTHGNVTWDVYNVLVDLDLTNDEVSLVIAPLFHAAALTQVLFPILLKGGTAVLAPSWTTEGALDLIERHRVTYLFGVTTMFLSLSQSSRWTTADLSSVRTLVGGDAPLPEALLRTYFDRGLLIIQGYGLTEASPGVSLLRADDSGTRMGSAGTPCFFTDVRVVDPVGEDVGPGGTGEALVAGPNVSPGYWKLPQITVASFADGGWLRTGDLATVDEGGYLTIAGRAKDMYISGGENVYPAEVEQAIYDIGGIAECAVIGVPDAHWGEVGLAVVKLAERTRLTEQELIIALDGRQARHKMPKSVVFVDALPHNASGN